MRLNDSARPVPISRIDDGAFSYRTTTTTTLLYSTATTHARHTDDDKRAPVHVPVAKVIRLKVFFLPIPSTSSTPSAEVREFKRIVIVVLPAVGPIQN